MKTKNDIPKPLRNGTSKQIRTAEKCEWIYDDCHYTFNTSCDGSFSFTTDGVKENEFKYCPYCGKPIEERKREINED